MQQSRMKWDRKVAWFYSVKTVVYSPEHNDGQEYYHEKVQDIVYDVNPAFLKISQLGGEKVTNTIKNYSYLEIIRPFLELLLVHSLNWNVFYCLIKREIGFG